VPSSIAICDRTMGLFLLADRTKRMRNSAAAITARADTAQAAWAPTPRPIGPVATADIGCAPEADAPPAIHFNSLARSLALCHRSSGSFARHFTTTRSNDGGVNGWTCVIGGNQAGAAPGVKGRLARHHLVQHQSKPKNVSASIGLFAFQLLWSHVLERPDQRALGGELRLVQRHLGQGSCQGSGTFLLGQPEVHQLGAVLREHYVGRLKIAMRDAQPVCAGQRVSNLTGVAQGLIQRQRAAKQSLFQRLAFQQLHDEEIHSVLMTDIVQRTDVRV